MQINDVITELGEIVGIHSLAANQYGVVHLTIENIGDLFIDNRNSDGNHFVFVYLLRVYEYVSVKLYEQALLLCDYRYRYPFLVNPVLRNDQALGFAIKHVEENFNVPILRQSIEVLKDLQDKLENIIS